VIVMTDVYWLEQCAAEVRTENDWLSAREASLLQGMHFAKRHDDWRLGRWTAKQALAFYFDVPPHPRALAAIEILPGDSGAPEVVFANRRPAVALSISHSSGLAMCAVAGCGISLGCDLELIEARSDNFVSDYFTPDEQELIASISQPDRPCAITLLWSAKESTLKALHVGLRADTRSVTIHLGELPHRTAKESNAHASCSARVSGQCNIWQRLQSESSAQTFHGWWQCSGTLIRTLVSAPPPGLPIRATSGSIGL
jgi:4'-phosphopantetheinyl transferase